MRCESSFYDAAMEAVSASVMAGSLLQGCFSPSTLICSNLTGQRTKAGPSKGKRNKKLDPNVLLIIKRKQYLFNFYMVL